MAIEKELAKNNSETNKSTLEKESAETPNNGLIKVDTGKLTPPKHFLDELEEEKPIWQIEPITLIILILAIVFISFITVLVSRMPQK